MFLFAWFVVDFVWLTSTSTAGGCDAIPYNATRGFLLAYAMAIFCCFASVFSACCLLCKPTTTKKVKATEEVEEVVEVAVEGAAAIV